MYMLNKQTPILKYIFFRPEINKKQNIFNNYFSIYLLVDKKITSMNNITAKCIYLQLVKTDLYKI